MKKERNCGMAVYPNVVPSFGGMLMGDQMVPMGQMMPGGMMPTTTNTQNNYGASEMMSRQLNALEQRVSRLENIVGGSSYSTNYNSTNYQMM